MKLRVSVHTGTGADFAEKALGIYDLVEFDGSLMYGVVGDDVDLVIEGVGEDHWETPDSKRWTCLVIDPVEE
jgi:hypothetical protein